MGKVSKLFAEVQKTFEEHVAEHPDCPMAAPERFALTDDMRVTLLTVANEGLRHGVLEPEDELDLEVAIGTWGDPENFGWPTTTPPWQRLAVAIASALTMEAMDADENEDPLEAMLGNVTGRLEQMFESGGRKTKTIAVKLNPDDLPAGLLEMLPDEVRRVLGHQKKDEDESVDWLKRGYL